jgi:uncharacterized NAD(P)/FAD-binding protein YdhS
MPQRLETGMAQDSRAHVIVIGGGLSGTLLACQLLRMPSSRLSVTLIERRPQIGVGIAYDTDNPDHLLNVRIANMSAFPDDPEHFWRWLIVRGVRSDPFCFVSRQLYGRYIGSLLKLSVPIGARPDRLTIVHGECADIKISASGVTATLQDGTTHSSDIAVLATGHETAGSSDSNIYADPWVNPREVVIAPEAAVLILGAGLTMVDYALSLIHSGHAGPIIALSRRGLLPHTHWHVGPYHIDAAEVPFGSDIVSISRWLRGHVASHTRNGGDWRSVIDGLRPFTQQIWQSLPLRDRRRFLEHLRAYWDVHRHRMAPEISARVKKAIKEGRLTIVAGKLCSVEPNGTGANVHIRRRGGTVVETMQVAKIVECKGLVSDPSKTANPVMRSLFDQGLIRPDPLGIDIEVTKDCEVVDRSGQILPRLFAVGPLTRAAFWEIVAVPDIRVQCAQLAHHILGRHRMASNGPTGVLCQVG